MAINNEIFVELDSLGEKIKVILNNVPNFNILTDELEAKLLNQQNIIDNRVLHLRPDIDYKNSNVTKSFIGLENVSNDLQVRYSDKSTVLQATTGENDEVWMTPYKTYEAITQFNLEQQQSETQKINTLIDIWLYSGF